MRPKKPQELVDHACINLRIQTAGGLLPWEFEKGGRELKVRVEGRLVFNNKRGGRGLSVRIGTGRSLAAISPSGS
jgi:hypothetical protein